MVSLKRGFVFFSFFSFFLSSALQAKLLVIINQKSGSEKGEKIYREMVQDTLALKFKENIEVHNVQRGRFAYDLLKSYEGLESIEGIVGVGGDGTISKIFKALIERDLIEKIPVGVIPGGSGNGLATSIFHHHKNDTEEEMNPQRMARRIISGKTTPLTLWEVETNKGDKGYSFLGLSFGLLSDISINSEPLRCLLKKGRVYFMGLIEWMRNKSYSATLSWVDRNNVEQIFPGTFKQIWAMNITHGSEGVRVAPEARLGDDFLHIMHISKEEANCGHMFKFITHLKKGFHKYPFVHMEAAKSLRLELHKNEKLVIDGNLVKPKKATEWITLKPYAKKARVFSFAPLGKK